MGVILKRPRWDQSVLFKLHPPPPCDQSEIHSVRMLISVEGTWREGAQAVSDCCSMVESITVGKSYSRKATQLMSEPVHCSFRTLFGTSANNNGHCLPTETLVRSSAADRNLYNHRDNRSHWTESSSRSSVSLQCDRGKRRNCLKHAMIETTEGLSLCVASSSYVYRCFSLSVTTEKYFV